MDRLKVTICIPYFERLGPLEKTMDSFCGAGYFRERFPYAVDISLCDDGSIQQPIPEQWNKYPVFVDRLPPKHDWRNPCVALNAAVANCLETDVLLLQGPEAYHLGDVITPMVKMLGPSKRHNTVLGPIRGKRVPVKAPFWWCQMLHLSMFEAIGGFDETFRKGKGGEDTDFYNRLLLAGANFMRFEGPPMVEMRKKGDTVWAPHKYPTGHPQDPNCKLLKQRYGQTAHIRPKDRDKIRGYPYWKAVGHTLESAPHRSDPETPPRPASPSA